MDIVGIILKISVNIIGFSCVIFGFKTNIASNLIMRICIMGISGYFDIEKYA